MSPKEYVLNTRLKKACSLLSGTDMSIDDIALECCFISSNYFYKVFRQKLNTTPGRYRKEHTGKLSGAVELAKI